MYKLFDHNSKEISYGDLQDKGPWCELGLSREQTFLERFGDKLGLSMNPNKKTDRYAPDLINDNNHKLGDLKTQNTPFFQSKARYNVDPQYAVVFNQKDRERYEKKYPHIEIYFWVEWIATRFVGDDEEIKVNPMSGVWYVDFKELDSLLDKCPLHWYSQRRGNERGNARCSYVLSLQDYLFRRVA